MEERNLFSIVTNISEEQKTQLYALLEEFENECDEKNSGSSLPVKMDKKNIVQELLSRFKKFLQILESKKILKI